MRLCEPRFSVRGVYEFPRRRSPRLVGSRAPGREPHGSRGPAVSPESGPAARTSASPAPARAGPRTGARTGARRDGTGCRNAGRGNVKTARAFASLMPVRPTKWEGVYSEGPWLLTRNLVPGVTVYGEGLVRSGDVEFRRWDANRSKLAAYLK